jgi:hypothetical protein
VDYVQRRIPSGSWGFELRRRQLGLVHRFFVVPFPNQIGMCGPQIVITRERLLSIETDSATIFAISEV